MSNTVKVSLYNRYGHIVAEGDIEFNKVGDNQFVKHDGKFYSYVHSNKPNVGRFVECNTPYEITEF